MKITISGKNIEVGSSLQSSVESKISEIVAKYLDRVTDASVVFSKEAHHMFRTDITIHTGTHSGIVIRSSAEDQDVYTSLNQAVEKVEKQLSRYKRKLKDHHKDNKTSSLDEGMKGVKYVISQDEDKEPEGDAPLIIAEKATAIEHLTVSEAVMKMDLANLPALMFINKSHGGLNVVYKRVDGNISWVDPNLKTVKAA